MIDRRKRPPGQHVSADTCQPHDKRKTQDEDDEDFTELLLDALFGAHVMFAVSRVALQLFLVLLVKLMSYGDERGGGIYGQQQREHRRVPGCQPDADRGTGRPCHGSPSCKTNPTPRTV